MGMVRGIESEAISAFNSVQAKLGKKGGFCWMSDEMPGIFCSLSNFKKNIIPCLDICMYKRWWNTLKISSIICLTVSCMVSANLITNGEGDKDSYTPGVPYLL